ncbi:MAG: chorismate lyase [Candidatus Methylopumilus sp.]|nr:chorismate lyase [Candidatus Methylopumilus sp.]
MTWLIFPTVEGNQFSWLTEGRSLTERLKKELNDVKVDVIYEGKSLENKTDYIREVILKSHDQSMIFARTLLKDEDVNGAWHCLKTLGQQSLANILFKDPNIFKRSVLYRECLLNDPLHIYLKSLGLVHEEVIWTRQSEWEKDGKTLTLIEVFLPHLFN